MLRKVPAIAWMGVFLTVAVGSIWWLFGRGPSAATDAQAVAYYSIVTDDPDILEMGRGVYQLACASCHGANFEGQENWRRPGADGLLPAPPHDPSGHTWHHSDLVLFNVVKFGPGYNVAGYRSRMQGYEGVLSDDEIRAVNSYIAAQWPADILKRQRAINADWEAAQASTNQ